MIKPLKYIRKNDKKVFIVSECYLNRKTNKIECIVLSSGDEYIEVNDRIEKDERVVRWSEFNHNFRKVKWFEVWI